MDGQMGNGKWDRRKDEIEWKWSSLWKGRCNGRGDAGASNNPNNTEV